MSDQPDPLDYPFWPTRGLDPYAGLPSLRERPLARVRLPYGEEAWLATRHEDVRVVLSDPRFSLSEAARRDPPRTTPQVSHLGGLVGNDAPDHTRLRSLLGKAFTARRIERLREDIRGIADGLLDRMTDTGPPADLVEGFAFPLPLTAICELIGVPRADHPHVRAWADTVCSGKVPPERMHREATAFTARLAAWVDDHRREPADDLLSLMIGACDKDGTLSEEELMILVNELLVGGFVTTASQIGNFFSLLLHSRGEGRVLWDRLRADPGLVPQAVEELLRYLPLFNGMPLSPRYALEDIELGGVLVRRGEPVIGDLCAANRDPAAFPDPDRIALDRSGTPHFTLGHGIHYCLGAHLARLELQVALERVLTRMPNLRLTIPYDDLNWRSKEFFIGLHTLPVAW
ncbi:cytochrome P450 [Streptomyces sp. NBC_01565]|uniref:cytochrome P450 n=1 Tax=Streptomyces sp. NBC_01565 TaxID=2975881 RepID=UPI00225B0B34|nr:cytochrome P450 [Streptomyces sp. NBC_01565]MCX4545496.1 cytochrome P450 [Streptomyces sp. NBC_01565]